MEWQDRALKFIKKNIGYVSGTIVHNFHGKKRNRFYVERWKCLDEKQYDPIRDIKRDYQGLFQLDTDKIKLRDDIRKYFRARNEDSVDDDD